MFVDLKEKLGFSKLDPADFQDFRDKTMRQLIKQAGVPVWKLPSLITTFHQEMAQFLSKLEFNPGVEGLLRNLKKKQFQLGILSSNSQENLEQFLAEKNADYFDFVYSCSSLFGKHRTLAKLFTDLELNQEHVVYVGDETRDIEACQKLGVMMAAVDWGLNSNRLLKQYDPDYLVSSPQELLKLLT